MRDFGRSLLKSAFVATALATVLALSSCTLSQFPQIPPDVGATDPDRFVSETNPVWARK